MYTKEGLELKFSIKKLIRLQWLLIENPDKEVEEITKNIDSELSKARETIRQYKVIFGEIKANDWINGYKVRLRIAREVLEQAEYNDNIIIDHNL